MREQEKEEIEPRGTLLSEVTPRQTDERDYRRGYRDGWVAAVRVLSDLMHQAGASRSEAIQECFNHWQRELGEWEQRARKENHLELPPKVKIMKAKRRGEHP